MHIRSNYVLKTSCYAKAKLLKYNQCQKETRFVSNVALGATSSQWQCSEFGTKAIKVNSLTSEHSTTPLRCHHPISKTNSSLPYVSPPSNLPAV